jgi:long-chain acyl-CoA synthetase
MAIANIAGIVRLHGRERPDQVAIVYGDREVTWRELDERSSQLANALAAAGVQANDRIARIEKNAPDYFELAFAASKLNAVLVDVNWRLAPAEMRQIVDDASAKVLFVGEEFASHLDKIESELASVTTTILLGAADATHPAIDAWASEQSTEDPGVEGTAQDTCLQLYTSGTTGLPKGVMLSNENLFSFIDEVPKQWEFTPESVSHVVMPTFHIAGSGWGLVSLAMGSRMILDREVNPVQILQEVEAHRITHAIYVPAVLQFLQIVPNAHDHDLTSMQLVAYGASPITEQVLRAAMAQFATAKFVQVYGLTETTGAVVQLDAEDHDPENRPELLRSAGKPYPWIQLRVVGADGEDVAPGEIGEIWMKGVQVMVGYWNNPEETARAITPDGWFRSGDAGYLDADGYLFLHDRVKDMIVSGGENVYPAEVENAVMGCPGVADVAVIGVPDERWGEAVKAIVVKKADAEVSADDVIAWTRERIAGFKVPKTVDFADELPRNPSGKILKKDLRAPYWEGRERQIN